MNALVTACSRGEMETPLLHLDSFRVSLGNGVLHPHAQGSAWHIKHAVRVGRPGLQGEGRSQQRDTSLDSLQGPSPSIYDYDCNWRVCGNQAFGHILMHFFPFDLKQIMQRGACV